MRPRTARRSCGDVGSAHGASPRDGVWPPASMARSTLRECGTSLERRFVLTHSFASHAQHSRKALIPMSLSARIAYGPSYFSPLVWENEDDVRGQDRIHTHGSETFCAVCYECDHSQRNDCPDCGEPSVLIAARRDLAMRLYDED